MTIAIKINGYLVTQAMMPQKMRTTITSIYDISKIRYFFLQPLFASPNMFLYLQWKSLSDNEKSVYEKMAFEDKKRYDGITINKNKLILF